MKNRREGGFTLVELMVVIVLIGLLAGVVGVNVIPLIFQGKETIARNQLKEFKTNLELYLMEQGRLPETLDELTTELENRDPYMEEIPLDPWDQEYVYVAEYSGRGQPSCQSYGQGPDMIDGSPDDITLSTRKDQ